ncbi:SDR family NAD(P)-dependent oxidoreductase [bacterium]|jgi:NAD(P)-dependent dehydrogenase (short-subunit alcohol dehydrogenase family)|nr:SDR family NAD(P)-dependent oxidoreductase [bacterium]MBT4634069.1 SDR family NAD(P)-dependent oxidoreductase [bacterium]
MNIENLDLQFLKSKTVVITGSSRGIGHSIAKKLLDLGNIVIGTSREIKSLDSLSRKFNRNFYPMELNLESSESVESLASLISNDFDKIDVLICNAGVLGDLNYIENYSYQTWCKTMTVNLNNQFLLIQKLLPFIQKSKKGSIIITSSSVGQKPRENWGAYSISKYAMEGVSSILSAELKDKNIIVNTVNPGGTATSMRRDAMPKEDSSKLPQPSDVLPIFLYLSSNEAHETGQSFNARDYIGLLNF